MIAKHIFRMSLIAIFLASNYCASATPVSAATPPGFIKYDDRVYNNKRKQHTDIELINVKNKFVAILEKTSKKYDKNAKVTSSQPMSLTTIEMVYISAPRSSWLTLLDNTNSVIMDSGDADMVSAQVWTLPANVLDQFESYYNEDFVPIAEVPEDLRFDEANKVVRSEYEDSAGNTIEVYDHYIIDDAAVDYIGVSYYYYLDEDEDAFDAADYKFSDVPLQLGDGYTYQVQEVETALRNLRYIESEKEIDAFGTLNTPYGTFDCLRISFTSSQYSRPDIDSAYVFDFTVQSVGFITDQGHFFLANNTSAKSGMVTLDNLEFRVVAPTGILSDQSEVQINNDGAGVLISNTGVYIDVLTKTADKDAILDLESEDKGLMIPRLTQAQRPASPNQGLLIYQIDNTPGFYYYEGSAWTRLDNTTPGSALKNAESIQPAIPTKTYKKGFGTLVNGSVFVPVNASNDINPEELLIQLQPEGECNGLYISKKTSKGFEVKELNNGKSSIRFSWILNQ